MNMLKPYLNTRMTEAGCDEAGRGCLAGPVFAAAVILPKKYRNKRLNDSKKLTPRQRLILEEEIKANAVAWSVASCSNKEIDSMNILRASVTAMHRALDSLSIRPQFILVDGNRFTPYNSIPHLTVIHGDAIYMSVAAASVLAKTARDRLMEELDAEYPVYGWQHNKGYPTAAHYRAIMEFGVTPWHRKTFNLRDPQTELHFL